MFDPNNETSGIVLSMESGFGRRDEAAVANELPEKIETQQLLEEFLDRTSFAEYLEGLAFDAITREMVSQSGQESDDELNEVFFDFLDEFTDELQGMSDDGLTIEFHEVEDATGNQVILTYEQQERKPGGRKLTEEFAGETLIVRDTVGFMKACFELWMKKNRLSNSDSPESAWIEDFKLSDPFFLSTTEDLENPIRSVEEATYSLDGDKLAAFLGSIDFGTVGLNFDSDLVVQRVPAYSNSLSQFLLEFTLTPPEYLDPENTLAEFEVWKLPTLRYSFVADNEVVLYGFELPRVDEVELSDLETELADLQEKAEEIYVLCQNFMSRLNATAWLTATGNEPMRILMQQEDTLQIARDQIAHLERKYNKFFASTVQGLDLGSKEGFSPQLQREFNKIVQKLAFLQEILEIRASDLEKADLLAQVNQNMGRLKLDENNPWFNNEHSPLLFSLLTAVSVLHGSGVDYLRMPLRVLGFKSESESDVDARAKELTTIIQDLMSVVGGVHVQFTSDELFISLDTILYSQKKLVNSLIKTIEKTTKKQLGR